MLPDVNILVAAHHAGHPHHTVAAQWLQNTLKGDERLRVAMPVVAGFLRLVTHPKIFTPPSPIDRAIDFVDWLLEDPRVQLVQPTDHTKEWQQLRKLAQDKQLHGNHIPDAWLAALSLSLGEPFVTFDKGFRQLLPRSLLVLLPTA